MKLSFALIAIFCVAVINATPAPTKKPGPIVNAIVNIIESFVKHFEMAIPGWDSKESLIKNVLTVIDKPLEAKIIPGWNPDASIRDNLINTCELYIETLGIKGLEGNKSLVENVKVTVSNFVNLLPIPSFFPKDQIKQDIVNNILEQLKKVQFKGFDVKKSLDENIVVIVDDTLDSVKGLDPKASLVDYVNAAVKNLFNQIQYPGYSPDKSLEDDVKEYLINLVFKNIPF